MSKTIDSLAETMDKFTAFLSANHMRKTPERFEILRCANVCKGHFDVDKLYHDLENHGYHVSKATIYSTLELLCRSGIVRKLLFDTHQARYEMSCAIHSHLICTQCGEIREIDLDEIDNRLSMMRFPDFTPSYVSTCIYGICEKCTKTEKPLASKHTEADGSDNNNPNNPILS